MPDDTEFPAHIPPSNDIIRTGLGADTTGVEGFFQPPNLDMVTYETKPGVPLLTQAEIDRLAMDKAGNEIELPLLLRSGGTCIVMLSNPIDLPGVGRRVFVKTIGLIDPANTERVRAEIMKAIVGAPAGLLGR